MPQKKLEKSYFITFNPHPSDVKKFNDFLVYLIPSVMNNFKNYKLVIEKEETPDAHFHAIVSDNLYRDSGKVCQKLHKDLWRPYKLFNGTETGKAKITKQKFNGPAWQIHHLPDEDKSPKDLKCAQDRIGYLFKECYNQTRQTNYSKEFSLECFKKYIMNEQIRAQKDKYHGLEEWKLLVPGNVHMHIQDFIKKNYPEDYFKNGESTFHVQTQMRREGYSFVKMTNGQIETVFEDLNLRRNKDYFKKPEYQTEALDAQIDEIDKKWDFPSKAQQSARRDSLEKLLSKVESLIQDIEINIE